MALEQKLITDLKEAMVSGDNRRRDVIRFLRAAINNAAIEKRSALTDDEILDVIRYQIKQRRDSIDLFRSGGREELAAEEEAQIAVLLPYLPAQMSEKDVAELVRQTADELGLQGLRDMSKLMPALIAATSGRAEGRVVSGLATKELARRDADSGDTH